ncbi:UNVERIFIED_CONTAM: hypothetical protein FKN15_033979 [Acipenser sinensis]
MWSFERKVCLELGIDFKKRIRATVNSQEQKRLLMDLDISMRTVDCHFTVTFYGALFREGDVWICMELMDTSLDKFYKQVIEKGMAIPEDILGKITVSLKEEFQGEANICRAHGEYPCCEYQCIEPTVQGPDLSKARLMSGKKCAHENSRRGTQQRLDQRDLEPV